LTKQSNLDELRKEIDHINAEILKLLNRRAELAIEVGRVKREMKSDFHVLDREQKIYQKLVRMNKGPFPNSAIRPVFREIISASLSLEHELRVVYLGPEATFSHLAAIKQFGQSATFVQSRSLRDIFTMVEHDEYDYGVVPIENTTEGVVNPTLDMFIDSPLKIAAEILLVVSHHLLSKKGTLQGIKEIHSHAQAIAQCSGWLERNVPNIPAVEVFSTAKAAETAAHNPRVAAIAGEFAAGFYGLKPIYKNIEDNDKNITRFWVISKRSTGPTGEDKTSIMMSIKDGVGALHETLKPFARHRINLTKIESRPFRQRPWEYIFFIDIEGHADDAGVKKALAGVRPTVQFLKILGSYPRSESKT
jgi:chorismate mutase/prephenate dehydratase